MILWEPIKAGDLPLKHRLVMAPMTRCRSTPDGTPTELNVEYYTQRASSALIVTEGTQPSDDGQGYLMTPGIYTKNHIAGWRKVTDGVHAAGGKIVIQLLHVGRIAHPENTLRHRQPVAPSAVQPNKQMFTMKGMQDMPQPRPLAVDEIAAIVRDYRHAAAAAIEAGADGVEIHGANGYLIQQFLSDNVNLRTDNYGGSVENKIRFALEVASGVVDEIGAGRTGIRLSPGGTFNDIVEKSVPAVYEPLVRELGRLNLAYLHVIHTGDEPVIQMIRRVWPGVLFLNRGGADIKTRAADIETGLTDVITVGTMILANPDLVERIKVAAPLNQPDPDTFYSGGTKGYTDYPTLAMQASS